MLNIPFKALRMGAESKNDSPIKYNKSRLSGSNNTTYNLHIKGASMPGIVENFTIDSTSKANLLEDLNNNRVMKSFIREKYDFQNYKLEKRQQKNNMK